MFEYSIDTIFKTINIESLYNAKQRVSEDGASLVDALSITDDERMFLDLKIKDVCGDLFSLTNRIFDGYEMNCSTIKFSLSAGHVTTKRYLELLSGYMEQYIVESILALWYISVNSDMSNVYINKLTLLQSAIKNLVIKVGYRCVDNY